MTDAIATAVVPVHLKMVEMMEAVRSYVLTAAHEEGARFRWVWIALVGIFIIAAAAGFVYCRARGYRGFNGRVEALRGPWGIKIGVKIGCY